MAAARLSIIDVVGGRQPLTNEDGTVTASQNGEIYNSALLREHFSSAATCFRRARHGSAAAPLEDDGCRLPERIDGMFAVAVWDRRQQPVFLPRPRRQEAALLLGAQRAIYYASS
jgi:asparagine synthase (glutamine-hydrolysing)